MKCSETAAATLEPPLTFLRGNNWATKIMNSRPPETAVVLG